MPILSANKFLETAEVYGNYYGTQREQLTKITAKNKHAVVVIDVQGAASLRQQQLDDLVTVFITPPSFDENSLRLSARATENTQDIKRRLDNYDFEIEQQFLFDIVLVNRDLARTVEHFSKIFIAYPLDKTA